jgi:hypothetical protein
MGAEGGHQINNSLGVLRMYRVKPKTRSVVEILPFSAPLRIR